MGSVVVNQLTWEALMHPRLWFDQLRVSWPSTLVEGDAS